MKVSALDKGTGKSNSVTIENERGRLSQEEIDRVSLLLLIPSLFTFTDVSIIDLDGRRF